LTPRWENDNTGVIVDTSTVGGPVEGEDAAARAAAKRAKTLALAARVRMLRGFRGYSQAILGQRSGLSRQYVSQLELGQRPRPRGETLEALARALGVTADQLKGHAAIPELHPEAAQPALPAAGAEPGAPAPAPPEADPPDYATALGFLPALPPGATLVQRRHPDGSVTVYLHIPGPCNRSATEDG
jgi:transcriptional regulator with XRE-family HTH domain